jgi:excisionase family DNA binding protein
VADCMLISLANGQWIALSRETFEDAIVAGTESVTAVSAPRPAGDVLEPLLDAEQAARHLGVTARWLEDSARAGIMPHHRLGRFIRFKVSELVKHSYVAGAVPPTDCQSVAPIRRLVRQ